MSPLIAGFATATIPSIPSQLPAAASAGAQSASTAAPVRAVIAAATCVLTEQPTPAAACRALCQWPCTATPRSLAAGGQAAAAAGTASVCCRHCWEWYPAKSRCPAAGKPPAAAAATVTTIVTTAAAAAAAATPGDGSGGAAAPGSVAAAHAAAPGAGDLRAKQGISCALPRGTQQWTRLCKLVLLGCRTADISTPLGEIMCMHVHRQH